MTAQHTPGPWKVADKRDQDLPYITADRGPVAKSYWLPGPHEAIANARLIAAAPDLLAALDAARGLLYELNAHMLDAPGDQETLALIDAAIAKATGQ